MKRSEIEKLLPEVFQREARPGTPLFALLEVMEDLTTPCEEALERLDEFFNPYRAPDHFVPMLARWLDLDRFLAESPEEFGSPSAPEFPSGLGSLRELIISASYLSKWRGTARGLHRFLETATGVQGFTIDEHPRGADEQPRPFHILVRAPEEALHCRQLILRIVEMEKPAYVTYEIQFAQEAVEEPVA